MKSENFILLSKSKKQNFREKSIKKLHSVNEKNQYKEKKKIKRKSYYNEINKRKPDFGKIFSPMTTNNALLENILMKEKVLFFIFYDF